MKILKTYKIIVRIGDIETAEFEVEEKNWVGVCDYVFGNIEVIEVGKKGVEK